MSDELFSEALVTGFPFVLKKYVRYKIYGSDITFSGNKKFD